MRTAMKAILVITLLTPLPILAQDVPAPSVSIHLAALQGNAEAVREHIKAGSDLNAKDPYGSKPLIIAATFGKTEVAQALIEAGADLDMTNNDGATALQGLASAPGSYWTDQLNNTDQLTSYEQMGEEIWEQSDGRISAFVQSVGTGAADCRALGARAHGSHGRL